MAERLIVSQFYLQKADGSVELVNLEPANISNLKVDIENLDARVDTLETKEIEINWDVK